jgi:hypothetical protein
MRIFLPIAGMLLLAAGPAPGQNLLGNSTPITFKPIDTSKAIKPPNMSKFTAMSVTPRPSPLANFIPNFSFLKKPPNTTTPALSTAYKPFQPTMPQPVNLFPPSRAK